MTQHNTSKLDRRKIFIQQGRLLTKRKVFWASSSCRFKYHCGTVCCRQWVL